MRIALIDPSLFTLPYDTELSRALQTLGHTVTLHGRRLDVRDARAGDIDVQPSFYGLSSRATALPKILRLGLKGLDHGWSLRKLLQRLRGDRPDIIHFQWLPLPLLDRMFLGRLREIAPVVLTVHDTNAFNGDPTAALQRLGFHAALRACDRLIVHTRQGEARLRAIGIPAARISVIPHGTTPAMPVQAEHPDQPVTFVLFGKLKPYKGADLLVEAFARLTERQRGRARVRIIGQSYMKLGGLQDRIAALDLADRITIEDRFVGDDEVAAVFAEGTIAVFPYREIEASGVLYLAIEHARPVIASAIGTFAESLTDGVHGSLVPSGDVAALSTAMARMIEDAPFRHAASAAIARLSQESPDWLQVGRLTQAAYAAVLGTTSSVERVPAAQLAQGI